MNIINIVEKWDGVLYSSINVVARLLYITKYFSLHQLLKKNKIYKDKHKGERCFIVLNGPSINSHDLSSLKNEVVFATNYFFRAPLCKVVEPKYYCWLDAKIFFRPEAKEVMAELTDACPNAHLFLNSKGYAALGDRDNVSYVFAKHLPNIYGVRNDMSGLCSNYSTVAFLAMSSAIYMGFKEIYVLGMDFEPGGFKHFINLGEGTECSRPDDKSLKDEVCGLHAGYSKAQYESYYVAKLAEKNNCRIINLNPNSCIRAFEFDKFENVIK